MGKQKKYPEEFRRSAVSLVIDQNYTREQAAKNLGIATGTLDNWLHKHRQRSGASHTAGELDLKKRVAELERENRRLTMERDILKKAAAYFAKDHL